MEEFLAPHWLGEEKIILIWDSGKPVGSLETLGLPLALQTIQNWRTGSYSSILESRISPFLSRVMVADIHLQKPRDDPKENVNTANSARKRVLRIKQQVASTHSLKPNSVRGDRTRFILWFYLGPSVDSHDCIRRTWHWASYQPEALLALACPISPLSARLPVGFPWACWLLPYGLAYCPRASMPSLMGLLLSESFPTLAPPNGLNWEWSACSRHSVTTSCLPVIACTVTDFLAFSPTRTHAIWEEWVMWSSIVCSYFKHHKCALNMC